MSRTSERRARRATARQTSPAAKGSFRSGAEPNRRIFWYAAGAVAVAAVLFLAYAAYNAAQPPSNAFVGTPVPNLGQLHVNPGQPHAAYNSMPPTSGPHFPFTAEWRFYKEPAPEEMWIHNLEHGGIVALYNCPQDCPDLTGKLEELYKSGPRSKYGSVKLVVAPYNKVPNKLSLVAWTYYLLLDDYNDETVRGFIRAHLDKGPEDIP